MKFILLISMYYLMFHQYAFERTTSHLSIEKDSIELIDYYMNGNKKLEGYYYHDSIDPQGNTVYVAVGKQIKYYSSGSIQGYQYFKNGVLHGKYESYTEQGIADKTFFYINGKLDGPYVFRYSDGQVMRIGTFKNDEDYGPSVRYNPDGSLALEEYYNEQGIREGEVKIYDKKGVLKKQVLMYNGKQKKN